MASSEIAVSMPIGGWHPLLPAALRSIALQTVPVNLAILDASGDPRVAAALDASGLEFGYRREGSDSGQAAAIAEGWRNVRGDVLAWLNADDLLVPDALSRALDVLDTDGAADAVFGDSVIIGINGEVLGVHGQVGDVDERIAVVNCISQPSCFFRRSAVNAVGGLDEALGYSMDWELWIRMQRAGCVFKRVHDHLSAVYWGVGTKTSELSPSRLFELFGHTRRHAGLVDATRMLVGVASQALMAAPGTRKAAGDLARRRAHRGLLACADWNPREQAQERVVIPLINPFDEPRGECVVQVEGGPCGVEASPAAQVVAEKPGRWRIRLNEAVAPGHAARITLTGSDEPSRLLRVAWNDAPSAA
mgnify:CR=1 FL=1